MCFRVAVISAYLRGWMPRLMGLLNEPHCGVFPWTYFHSHPEVQTKMLRSLTAFRLLLLTMAVLGLLVPTGCGVKGPPIPPKMMLPPPVQDLQGRVEDGRVVLTWTPPGRPSGRVMDVAGFRVYRSRIPLSDSDCPSCPLRFEQAAELSLGGDARARMTFSEALQAGHGYTYKVVGYGAGETRFGDSNLVELVFP